MRRISSRMTFVHKRIFPVLWFGFLAFFMAAPFVLPLVGGTATGSPVGFLLGPAFMMIIGYFIMKKLIFDLVDQVWDAGDALVIRNGHDEERVALSHQRRLLAVRESSAGYIVTEELEHVRRSDYLLCARDLQALFCKPDHR